MKNLPHVSVNGRIINADEARISPFDRGLRLGDGIFETIRVQDSRAKYLGRHIARLRSSAAALDFTAPAAEELETWVQEFLDKADLNEGALRLTMTRGEAGGVWPQDVSTPLVLITAAVGVPYPPEKVEEGLSAVVVDEPRRFAGMLSRHKTTSYLPSVLARGKALSMDADVAIMLNQHGRVADADTANIFVVSAEGRVTTPSLDEGALEGIIRSLILEALPEVEEQPVSVKELYAAREIVFTNALMPALPARSIDGKSLTGREFLKSVLEALDESA